MTLAYFIAEGRGAGDRMLGDLAYALAERGVQLAGVVQENTETPASSRCDMDLRVLGCETTVRISQNLGGQSQGCRLDPDGLARAVGLVTARLIDGAQMLILNKFGKAEAEGRGFRDVIGQALAMGVPVILAVKPDNLDAFAQFHEGLAERLAPHADTIDGWARDSLAQARV